MNDTKNYYSKAMIDDAITYLWYNHGIIPGDNDNPWNDDMVIQEATKKGWTFRFY